MKNIKTKKINKNNGVIFYKKVLSLSIFFTAGIYIFNIPLGNNFLANISDYGLGLLTNQEILENVDNIKDNSVVWPLRQVTDRSKVVNYEKTKNTDWKDLENNLKTPFPNKFSDTIEKYKFVSPYNIWATITNPLEREKVIFYKRLITTLWTTSYSCSLESCDRWIPNTGTHAGIDIVSSTGTPVYNSMNGIVMRKQSGNTGFGNYLVILTNFNGELLATFYAHFDDFHGNIKEGDIIKKGQQIGYIGNTGSSSTPHLHFQINSLGPIQDIKKFTVAQKMWEGWSGNDKTIETVRNSTLNPISFVEKNLGTVGDDLQRQDINVNTNNINEKNNENIKKENKNENEDLLQQITKQLEQEYSNNIQQNNNNKNIKEVLEIIEISNPKIDNKLTLGDNIKFTVKTKGEDGNITISSNNDVLKPSQYTITPKKEKNEYEVLVSAQNIGNGRVVFSDGKSNKDYYFSVYQDVQEIFSLGINGPDTIFNTVKQKFTIYPIDKLGNTVNYNLDGNINISLLDRETNKSYDLMNQKINKQNNLFKFEIQAPKISNYRLIVNFKDEKNNLSANKNLESDIFIDYSKNDKYGNSMKELNKKGIIKGFEGKMMPNNNIIRAEIITTLVRYKYGDDFERFKNEMNKYIEKNGIFFEDINPEARYSPYIFMAYQDGVVKGAGGTHANPTIQAQKDELIALYSRFFNISKKDQFPSFIDVNQDDWFVDYANAAKNYNLFPFENKNKFEGSDFVSREKAFESLYRYMNVGEKMQPKIKTTEQKLEDAVKALINF